VKADLTIYPGGEIVSKGLLDLALNIRSEEALVVSAAAPSLGRLGIEIPKLSGIEGSYEHALYDAIKARNPKGAHADYNAIIQRVFSFTQAYRR
jgi:hypothetical protein